MRRLKRPAVLLLLVAVTSLVGGAADKAKSLYAQGQDAEARQNYESAYDFYKQAYDLKPKDLRYRAAFERSRFLAASSHVHRGQKLRDDGNMDDAVAEFQHFDRDLVRRQHALGRQDHPDLPGLVEFELGMARQDRPAFLTDADMAWAGHRFNRLS